MSDLPRDLQASAQQRCGIAVEDWLTLSPVYTTLSNEESPTENPRRMRLVFHQNLGMLALYLLGGPDHEGRLVGMMKDTEFLPAAKGEFRFFIGFSGSGGVEAGDAPKSSHATVLRVAPNEPMSLWAR